MRCIQIFCVVFLVHHAASAQSSGNVFQVVPLGVRGGSDESNLSSYAVGVRGTSEYVCLDAGTIYAGIVKAVARGVWKGSPGDILKNNIKGYLISHPHLDHVSGLIMNSPEDSAKPVYGLSSCIDVLKSNYFTWKNWANFGNEGDAPALNKYTYKVLIPGATVPLVNTQMSVTAYTLSHVNPYESTAFLISYKDNYLLYLGDTGSDEIEKSDKLNRLWHEISPLIREKKLKALFIEVSFPNAQTDNLLFGHFTPQHLIKEMNKLSQITASNALINVPIVITHRKPAGNNEKLIREELKLANSLKLKLIYPEQGKLLQF